MNDAEYQAIHDEIWRVIYERQQPSFRRHTMDAQNTTASEISDLKGESASQVDSEEKSTTQLE